MDNNSMWATKKEISNKNVITTRPLCREIYTYIVSVLQRICILFDICLETFNTKSILEFKTDRMLQTFYRNYDKITFKKSFRSKIERLRPAFYQAQLC